MILITILIYVAVGWAVTRWVVAPYIHGEDPVMLLTYHLFWPGFLAAWAVVILAEQCSEPLGQAIHYIYRGRK